MTHQSLQMSEPEQDKTMERRRSTMVKDIAVPVIASVVVGVSSSYMATSVAVAVLEERVETVQEDINSMQSLVSAVQANQIELAARGAWISRTDAAIEDFQKRISSIENNRYTINDADRDYKTLMREIELRHMYEKKASINAKNNHDNN